MPRAKPEPHPDACKAYRPPLLSGSACAVCGFLESQHSPPSSSSESPLKSQRIPLKSAVEKRRTPKRTEEKDEANADVLTVSSDSKGNLTLTVRGGALSTSLQRPSSSSSHSRPRGQDRDRDLYEDRDRDDRSPNSRLASERVMKTAQRKQKATQAHAQAMSLEREAALVRRAGDVAARRGDLAEAEERYLEAAALIAEARTATTMDQARPHKHTREANNATRRLRTDGKTEGRSRTARGLAEAEEDVSVGGRTRRYGDADDGEDDDADDTTEDELALGEYDADLSQQLSRTLLTPRELHLREDLMQADKSMLDALGWHPPRREVVLKLFRRFCESPHMLYENFIKLCSSRGVGLDLKRLFGAFDRRQHGTWLSDADFLMGVAALDPATPHNGVWRQARQSAIFRYYSRTGRGLTREELSRLVGDAIDAAPSVNLHKYATAAEASRRPGNTTGRAGQKTRAALVTWSHDKRARPGEYATVAESTLAYVDDLLRNKAVSLGKEKGRKVLSKPAMDAACTEGRMPLLDKLLRVSII